MKKNLLIIFFFGLHTIANAQIKIGGTFNQLVGLDKIPATYMGASATVKYSFSKRFSAGVDIGYNVMLNDDRASVIPATIGFNFFLLNNENVFKPFIGLNIGAMTYMYSVSDTLLDINLNSYPNIAPEIGFLCQASKRLNIHFNLRANLVIDDQNSNQGTSYRLSDSFHSYLGTNIGVLIRLGKDKHIPSDQ